MDACLQCACARKGDGTINRFSTVLTRIEALLFIILGMYYVVAILVANELCVYVQAITDAVKWFMVIFKGLTLNCNFILPAYVQLHRFIL
jgi:hypothetical protein